MDDAALSVCLHAEPIPGTYRVHDGPWCLPAARVDLPLLHDPAPPQLCGTTLPEGRRPITPLRAGGPICWCWTATTAHNRGPQARPDALTCCAAFAYIVTSCASAGRRVVASLVGGGTSGRHRHFAAVWHAPVFLVQNNDWNLLPLHNFPARRPRICDHRPDGAPGPTA